MKRVIEHHSFEDIKKKALDAAREGMRLGFGQTWKEKYINCYTQETITRQYEKMIELYRSYLLGKNTEVDTEKQIEAIQDEYQKLIGAVDEIDKFMAAEEKAFKDNEIEFGQVKFKCPLCGGEAGASRYRSEDGERILLAGGCSKCAMKYIS